MTRISTTSSHEGFAIEVVSAGAGRIVVGDFTEAFPMDLTFWDSEHYEKSWANALRRLEGADVATSCLVSSITDPKTANFVFCWPLYRIRDDVFAQNSLIILNELDNAFDPESPWLSVGPREIVDEDGNKISEWRTDIGTVREFRAVSGWT
ncbi:hypothetical protein OOK58_12335 [Streptomyces sp. NBC_01728]|uniref:hypothetical protein n=1 Tax=unclassified Streptomyces TaxID=2593676 RepID=UPI002259A8E8|nr:MULTISPECIES: hypothetical protein [unclassified Streptomyces]MCX4452872.1 hypothetical protein [Streptomyces sp. NBC_01719]MCX4492232.1 hypothetical protein [Streptomyces sp. NBC_01728]